MKNAPEPVQHPASFRDPSGYVVRLGEVCYRQVDKAGAEDYERLLRSGLYDELIARKYLIPHTEIEVDLTGSAQRYKTLLPRQIPFISYPTEWSPDQLRDVALLTLDVLELSLDHGMILKDASPMNVQFEDRAPIFIDTLSFAVYDASKPWIAYRQFCECCLFPLYLHRYTGDGIHRIFAAYPEGIPAVVTARLLPAKSRLSAGVWMHVLLQSRIRSDGRGDGRGDGKSFSFSKEKMLRLIHNLRQILNGLDLQGRAATDWSGYYGERGSVSGQSGSVSGQSGSISGESYLKAKEKLFLELAGEIEAVQWLDLGANDGHFTRLLAGKAERIIAVDSDWLCIDRLYLATRKGKIDPLPSGRSFIPDIIPLCMDLCDPTPASGFRNKERTAFSERARSEAVVALALMHHLVLGRNIPLTGIALYLAELTRSWLIVEFVPLNDEKALGLVRSKRLWHTPYDRMAFESAFDKHFHIERSEIIPGTERVLYRMRKRDAGGGESLKGSRDEGQEAENRSNS